MGAPQVVSSQFTDMELEITADSKLTACVIVCWPWGDPATCPGAALPLTKRQMEQAPAPNSGTLFRDGQEVN